MGSDLKGDLFITGDAVVEFDSGNCTKTKGALALVSSEGFVLNGTVSGNYNLVYVIWNKSIFFFNILYSKKLIAWKAYEVKKLKY